MLFEKDEVTWQTLLYELVKTEQMDPWDIDLSILTNRYITTIKKLKEFNFRVSGKVLLAAAILLRIKSNRLLNEDLTEFDRLISGKEEEIDDLTFEERVEKMEDYEKPNLIPRTPQPRKRKVSIYDLVGALQKALEVKKRRVMNSIPPTNVAIPKKPRDITQVIREVYGRIKSFIFKNDKDKVTFSQLTPSTSKEDRIYTFIPLLHLSNQRKVELHQEEHFGEIDIMLKQEEKEVDEELSEA
jgi:segregation and condensation protein A